MGKREQDEEISRLYQIIENELQKPEDEMDSSLIAECSEFIEELRQEQGEKQSIDYDKTLESIYAKIEGGDADRIRNSVQHTQKPRLPRRKRVLIRFAAALVAILVLMMSITVVAVRNGYSSAWEYLVVNIKEIMDMSCGDTSGTGNITMVINNHGTQYSSIEELLKTEQLSCFYPSVLPEGIEIQRVVQYDIDGNKKKWHFQTSDMRLSITVYNHYRTPLDKLENSTEYQTELLNFVITPMDDNTYQAIAHRDEYEYIIYSDNYDILLKILTGMKGIDK